MSPRRKPPVLRRLAALLPAACALALSPLLSQDAPAPAPPESSESPFTNAIPRAVFRDLPDERDPFSPVGYVKPRPPKPGEVVAPPKPVVEFETYLVITGISSIGAGSIATLATGSLIEAGETYPVKDKEGNPVSTFKVVAITEEKVVALFEGKEYEFKVRGPELDRFIEKEDPNEKKKP
jgi:hypothetical protein